jgi:LmbE family N-acetylglucosaminyl deacetylase
MDSFRPDKLLCIVAHPDDIEFTIGGTVAKWASEGCEVSYLVCTDGSKGIKKPEFAGGNIAHVRAKEQHSAMQHLGACCCHQLDHVDGDIIHSADLTKDIVKCIRAHTPDTVFTMDPTFLFSSDYNYPNHRDHRIVGQAVFDAVYPMSRDEAYYPELLQEGLKPHSVQTLLMSNFDKENYFVDISDFFSVKIEALRMHQSQLDGDDEAVEMLLRRMAENNGNKAGTTLAEGFVRLDIFKPR